MKQYIIRRIGLLLFFLMGITIKFSNVQISFGMTANAFFDDDDNNIDYCVDLMEIVCSSSIEVKGDDTDEKDDVNEKEPSEEPVKIEIEDKEEEEVDDSDDGSRQNIDENKKDNEDSDECQGEICEICGGYKNSSLFKSANANCHPCTYFFNCCKNKSYVDSVALISDFHSAFTFASNGVVRIAGTQERATIYNLGGAKVYEGTDREIALPSGVYVVRIGTVAKKIIIE